MNTKITKKDLEKRFNFYLMDAEQTDNSDKIRSTCLSLAKKINKSCPDSREKSIALTKLEEVMFWTNAGIARKE